MSDDIEKPPHNDDDWHVNSIEVIQSFRMGIPSHLTSPAPKKPLELGPRRVKQLAITMGIVVPSAEGCLIGMDSGYVGLWFLPGSHHLNPYLLMGYHRGPVASGCDLHGLAFGAGGRPLVATGGADGTIRIWTYKAEATRALGESNFLIQTVAAHKATVTGIVCAGNSLISSSVDGTVKLWKTRDGRDLAFYPWFEQTQVIATSSQWFMCLGFAKSTYTGGLSQLVAGTDHGGLMCFEVHFSTDGTKVLSVDPSPRPRMAHLRAGSDLAVCQTRVYPSRELIIASFFDNTVKLIDNSTGSVLQTCANDDGLHFLSMAIDDANDQLVLLDKAGQLVMYDVYRGRIIASKYVLEELGGEAVAVHWRGRPFRAPRVKGGGSSVMGGGTGGSERSSPERGIGGLGGGQWEGSPRGGEEGGGRGASTSPRHGQHPFGRPPGRLPPTGTGSPPRALPGLDRDRDLLMGEAESLRSASGSFASPSRAGVGPVTDELVVVSTGGVSTWRVVRGLQYSIVPGGHKAPVAGVSASSEVVQMLRQGELAPPQSIAEENEGELERIMTCSMDREVRVWDAYDLTCMRRLMGSGGDTVGSSSQPGAGEVACMLYLPYRQALALGHENSCISMVYVETGTVYVAEGGHRPGTTIQALCYLPMRGMDRLGPGYVASAGSDGRIGLWELDPKPPAHPHHVGNYDPGHPDSEVTCLASDPLLGVLLSGGHDGSVHVWLSLTREFVLSLALPGDRPQARCMTCYGGRVFVGREDGALDCYDLYSASDADLKVSLNKQQRSVGSEILARLRSDFAAQGVAAVPLKTVEAHSRSVTDMHVLVHPVPGFSPELLTSSLDGCLRVWDCATQALHKELSAGGEEVRCFCVRAKELEAIAGTSSGRLVKFHLDGEME